MSRDAERWPKSLMLRVHQQIIQDALHAAQWIGHWLAQIMASCDLPKDVAEAIAESKITIVAPMTADAQPFVEAILATSPHCLPQLSEHLRFGLGVPCFRNCL